MATVTGYTAERMLEIENNTVVSGTIEGDNLILTTRGGASINAGNVRGPQGPVGADVPVGVIQMFAGDAAPDGYLRCEGQAISRDTYSDLFTLINTTFGVGDGSTTFNLPDLRSRFPVGKGTATWSDALNEKGGSATLTIVEHAHAIPNHVHTMAHQHTMAHVHTIAHTHTWSGTTSGAGAHHHNLPTGWSPVVYTGAAGGLAGSGIQSPAAVSGSGALVAAANHTHTVSGTTSASSAANSGASSAANTGASSAANTGNPTSLPNTANTGSVTTSNTANLPPYITLNFIIRVL